MNRISLLLIFLLPVGVFGQELISPATINTLQTTFSKRVDTHNPKSGELIELPFVDDFSSDNFPGNPDGNPVLWQDRFATLNRGLAVNPPTQGVVSFDGSDEVGYPYSFDPGTGPADTLTSCPINLEYDPNDGVGFSFYYQPKGNSFFSPSADSDSLILEFYAPLLDQWFWIWSTVDVSDDENFIFVYIPITDTKFLREGFQFRFRNIAFLQGLYSVWNVDYVWLDLNEINSSEVVNDVAFVEGVSSFITDYTSMPNSHYAEDPEARMIQEFDVLFRNLNDGPRTLEGNEIEISYEGSPVGSITNLNEPPIPAQSTLAYNHTLEEDGLQFVFDPNLSEDELIFDVEVKLGTADFGPTVSNNSYKFKQQFYTHYSYDDGSAEAGYGVSNTGGRVALRYTNFKSDSVWALKIYTMPFGANFENTTFSIRIWEDEEGIPGEELATASHEFVYGQNEYQQQIIYKFDSAVFIPSGSFFVGYQQSSQAEGLRVGLDFNTTGNDGNLYFNDGNGWNPSIIAAQASVMIHPMFTSDGYDIIASTDNSDQQIPGLRVFPNPSDEFVNVIADTQGPLEVRIIDLQGRVVKESFGVNRLETGSFPSGLYLMAVTDNSGRTSIKKLAIEH